MQTPPETSHYLKFVAFGAYVARRVQQAGRAQLARDVRIATDKVKAAGRAWDDSDEAVQEAYASRDAADDALDLTAQQLRLALAGRALDAVRKEPYTQIFYNGLEYFTASPMDEEVARYTELIRLVEQYLPGDDGARRKALPALKKGVTEFETAARALIAAGHAQNNARAELNRLIGGFTRQMEKVYGLLIADEGREAAERYFPKTRVARPKKGEKPAPEPSPNG